jgi:hypothetical protein
MSGFTTSELLYPLTKGDKQGHSFHGNQYREVASEGSTNTPRPPVGKFQLSGDELKNFAKALEIEDYEYAVSGDEQKGAVALSKMLGFDKPATRVTMAEAPSKTPMLYRGCDTRGTDALMKPISEDNPYQKYGMSAYGAGVYMTTIENNAKEYVPQSDTGRLVKAWYDPNSTNLMLPNVYQQALGIDPTEHLDGLIKSCRDLMPPETQSSFDELSPMEQKGVANFMSSPAGLAMTLGYQGYKQPVEYGGLTLILDRSVLKVNFK